jgi:CHASE2 domain-containing sensor protein
MFLSPAWWYPAVVFAAGLVLAFGPSRRSNRAALVAIVFALLVFALVSLGMFGSSRVLLPAAPTLLTLLAASIFGRVVHRAGWSGS